MGQYSKAEYYHKTGNMEETKMRFNAGELHIRLNYRQWAQAVKGEKISKVDSVEDVRARILESENKPKTGMEAIRR